MPIGDEIKAARKRAKLTQEELAQKAGLSVMSIRRYESGEREPTLSQIQKITEALNVSMSQLLPNEHESGTLSRSVLAVLKAMYDDAVFDKHFIEEFGEPVYEGMFTVTLSKKGQEDIILEPQEWHSLLALVKQNIPAYIEMILKYKADYEAEKDRNEPDNYHGE